MTEKSLKEQAKTVVQIIELKNHLRFQLNRGEPTYETDKKYFEEFLETKWVPLGVAEKALREKDKIIECATEESGFYLKQWKELEGKVEEFQSKAIEVQKELARIFKVVSQYRNNNQLDLHDLWERYEQLHNYFLRIIREFVEVFGLKEGNHDES